CDCSCVCFFFQAEDGIRDKLVTGVQTCALPIFEARETVLTPPPVGLQQHLGVGARGEAVPQRLELGAQLLMVVDLAVEYDPDVEIGRASCRERVEMSVVDLR